MNLPNQMLWEREGKRVLLVHGNPRRLNEYVFADRPERSLIRMPEFLDINFLILGQTHLPHHRIVGDVYIVNAGSVGSLRMGIREPATQ